MNIMLDRILSLLPAKANGQFIHGAKKRFAISIGYDSGDIVSMWLNGSSSSYKSKLYEISTVYGVSIEWLRGETDIKEKPTEMDSFSSEDILIAKKIQSLTKEQRLKLEGYVDSLLNK